MVSVNVQLTTCQAPVDSLENEQLMERASRGFGVSDFGALSRVAQPNGLSSKAFSLDLVLGH